MKADESRVKADRADSLAERSVDWEGKKTVELKEFTLA